MKYCACVPRRNSIPCIRLHGVLSWRQKNKNLVLYKTVQNQEIAGEGIIAEIMGSTVSCGNKN